MEASPWILQDVSLDIENIKTPLGRVDFDIDDTSITDHRLAELPDVEIFYDGFLESIPLEVEPVGVKFDSDIQDVHDADLWGSVKPKGSTVPTTTRRQATGHDNNSSEPAFFTNPSADTARDIDEKESKLTRNTAFALSQSKDDILVRCSIELGLGLKSALFTFNRSGFSIVREEFLAASGISQSLADEVLRTIGPCGENFRAIATRIERIRGNIENSPSSIAAASAISQIVTIVRQHIIQNLPEAITLPQVQTLFRQPGKVISELLVVFQFILAGKDEVEAVNRLVAQAAGYEDEDEEWFRSLALQILVLTVKPFLDQISRHIGLLSADSRNNNTQYQAVLIGDDASQSTISDLFDEAQSRTISKIYRSLEFLRTYQPGHYLLNPARMGRGIGRGLELASSWHDIERIQNNLESLTDMAVLDSTHQFPKDVNQKNPKDNSDSFELSPYGLDIDRIQDKVVLSVEMLNRINSFGSEDYTDSLTKAMYTALHAENLTDDDLSLPPPLATLKIESFTPLLQAQSHSVNLACLKLVFHDHELLHNLNVLYDFCLLGSGIFAVGLRNVLFSWNSSTIEHTEVHPLNRKLKSPASQRSIWPPAGVELRLALAELLAECYRASHINGHTASSQELPGGLAFAVHNLSQPDLEICKDPTSLAAFDFLYLHYRPPGALNSIITKSALFRHDVVFRFLLRLSRVLFVVDRMWLSQRTAQRDFDRGRLKLAHRIYHFVSKLATYVFSSVEAIWHRYSDIMSTIETQLEQFDFQPSYDVFQLGVLHELMLDEIMVCLFLDQGQQSTQQALEETLKSVLQFAHAADSEQAHKAFATFESHSKTFLVIGQIIIEQGSLSRQESSLCPELKEAWSAGIASLSELQSLLFSLISPESIPVEASDIDAMDTL